MRSLVRDIASSASIIKRLSLSWTRSLVRDINVTVGYPTVGGVIDGDSSCMPAVGLRGPLNFWTGYEPFRSKTPYNLVHRFALQYSFDTLPPYNIVHSVALQYLLGISLPPTILFIVLLCNIIRFSLPLLLPFIDNTYCYSKCISF